MSVLDLAAINSWRVDATVKGFPGNAAPGPLSGIGTRGWNILKGDVPFPVAVIKTCALDHNRRWMKTFLAVAGVELAPHGKTSMCPQLFELQLEDGAWGMTCGTVEQLQVYRTFGVKRVLLANQIVGRAGIAYVARELARDPDFTFYCVVDSVDGVRHLAMNLKNEGSVRPLNLLVEMGDSQARTGARSSDHALAVAQEIARHPREILLAGIEGYEGTGRSATSAEAMARAERILKAIADAARRLDALGLFTNEPVILSAGGSEYFDLVAQELSAVRLSWPTKVVLRSGCYLTHDDLTYTRIFSAIRARELYPRSLSESLKPALEVWAVVQSRPEPTRAFLSAGKRDISFDMDLPAPKQWYRQGLHTAPARIPPEHAISRLNDQHAYLDLPADSPLNVGDLVGLGISHPCTTFDKWQLIYLVNDSYDITGAVRTFF